MKRIYVAALMFAAVSMTFTSCGGEKSKPVSEVPEVMEENDTVPDVAESESDGKTASNDFDAMLDDYEALVDEYDKFVSELKSGNVDPQSAMNAAAKAQEIQEKLETAKADMTAEQLKRMGKIAAKLTKIVAKAATIQQGDIKSVNGVNLEDFGM